MVHIIRLSIANLADEWRAKIIEMRLEGRALEWLIGEKVAAGDGREYDVLHANATCDHMLVTHPVVEVRV